jgi:hypothetical protein
LTVRLIGILKLYTGEKSLDAFVGEAFEDNASGPDADGGLDLALAFDVADVEAFAVPLGGNATPVESWARRVMRRLSAAPCPK